MKRGNAVDPLRTEIEQENQERERQKNRRAA